MIAYVRRLYDWMGQQVYSPHAEWILGFLFYLEAICFLPTDPILIVYCLERPQRGIKYATIATIGSVIGGISSYALGAFLWDAIGPQIIHNQYINYILTPEMFNTLCTQFKQYDWIAILIAGFTPVPYKAATLAAGFCKLNILPFIFCSIIARGARFYLLAIVIQLCGDNLKEKINKYFNILIVATFAIVALTIWWLC